MDLGLLSFVIAHLNAMALLVSNTTKNIHTSNTDSVNMAKADV